MLIVILFYFSKNLSTKFHFQDDVGWENIQLTVVRPTDPSPDGVCKNLSPSDDFLTAKLYPGSHYVEVRILFALNLFVLPIVNNFDFRYSVIAVP